MIINKKQATIQILAMSIIAIISNLIILGAIMQKSLHIVVAFILIAIMFGFVASKGISWKAKQQLEFMNPYNINQGE